VPLNESINLFDEREKRRREHFEDLRVSASCLNSEICCRYPQSLFGAIKATAVDDVQDGKKKENVKGI
jgi:hypothetical protein